MRTLPTLALALALCACSGASTTPDDREPMVGGGSEVPATGFGFDDAIAAARREMPDAIPIEVEHEAVEGVGLVEVELIDGDAVRELYYDPSTGEIARRSDEELTEAEQAALPALRDALSSGPLRLEDGLAVARRHHSDAELREVELEMASGRLAVQVEIDVGGAARAHLYDVETGEPVVEAERRESGVRTRAMEEDELPQ